MTFIESIKAGSRTEGRLKRIEYFVQMIFFVAFVRGAVYGTLSKDVPPFAKPIFILFGLFWTVPAFAESIKRLHDIGMSGKYMLIFTIPLLFQLGLGQTLIGGFFALPLLYLYFAPGTNGDNPWGKDPRTLTV